MLMKDNHKLAGAIVSKIKGPEHTDNLAQENSNFVTGTESAPSEPEESPEVAGMQAAAAELQEAMSSGDAAAVADAMDAILELLLAKRGL